MSSTPPNQKKEMTRLEPPKLTSTAAYLEHISTLIMEALTSCDADVIVEHLSPDFEMITACADSTHICCPISPADDLQQHLKNTALFKERFPKWTVEVSNAHCSMTKGSNTAEVWLSCRGLHTPESQKFNRETVHVLHWRRSKSQGNWCCYRHQGIGGGGDFF